jgi:DNA-binding transcriptional MerR regulator
VESDLRGIGQMARESGLTVSALRFYDGAGVLVPAKVNPHTGYREYRAEQVRDARLIAKLRRIGMGLTDIVSVVESQTDRPSVDMILAAHLRRLEHGLADARRELSAVQALLDYQERSMSRTEITLDGPQLLAALRSVRYAASSDPGVPMLGGVLLDIDSENGAVHSVATDRYRLLICTTAGTDLAGPAVSAIAPLRMIDELITGLSTEPATVTLSVDGDDIIVTGSAGWRVDGVRLDYEFPDYRRLIRSDSSHTVPVDADVLRTDLTHAQTTEERREPDGASYELAVLNLESDGELTVGSGIEGGVRIGVNREFLLQALEGIAAKDLVLELDGPIAPLMIRDSDRSDLISLLMPVRLR